MGTGIEQNQSFPIELSQIGSAVIKRDDGGNPKVYAIKTKIVLLLPKQNQGISDTLWEELRRLQKPEFFEIVDFTLPDLLADNYKDPCNKAGANARSLMHKLEIELIKPTDPFRNENCWLVLTSLFTYAWEPVHELIEYYSQKYKKAEIIVGGIYATLCEEHLRDAFKNRIIIHKGIIKEVEDILPDYSIVPNWKSSIIFTSRGCIRNCTFCSVKILEPKFTAKKSIKNLIYPGHKKIILWDNNILASPYWENIFQEIEESRLEIDFNQGLDARLITPHVVSWLLRLKVPIIRLAYDTLGIRKVLKNTIDLLKSFSFRGRNIIVYCLYNNPFDNDTPETFLSRLQDLIDWGVVSYPMRYEPLEPRPKNSYVSPKWTSEYLEMIAKARRVLGYGGAFPPYEGLKKKFLNAKSFEEAFSLREPKCK